MFRISAERRKPLLTCSWMLATSACQVCLVYGNAEGGLAVVEAENRYKGLVISCSCLRAILYC